MKVPRQVAETPPEQAAGILAARPPRYALGLRVAAWGEMALFFAIVFALDYFMFGGKRFVDVSPHPYWIIVLLISTQYGTAHGLAAAAVAVGALMVDNMPKPEFGQDAFQYGLDLFRMPLLWVVTAVILGELRVRSLRERDTLVQELTQSRSREQTITQAYQRLNATKERLETQVTGQMRTVVSSFKAAKAVEQQDPAMVLSGAADMVRSVMNPEKFSVYTLSKDGLEVTIRNGWTQEDNFKESFDPGTPLFQAVVGSQRFLCLVNRQDRDLLDDQGVLAGPLVSRETGNVTGMMKVENLGFLDLNLSTVENFKALCEWVGASHDTALRYQAARSDSVINHDHQLFSFGFFPRQVELMTNLGRRLNFEVTLLVIRVENPDDLTLEERKKIPAAIGAATKVVMRNTDMAFDYERPGFEFALLLPATPEKNMSFVIAKMEEAIKGHVTTQVPRARFSLTTQVLHKHREEPARG
ncbi:MAG: GAF domain-containing protein [Magnetococcales bacterium]|nr:GAF domain-containing protein [Magnetococcales bacterium]